MIEVSQLILVEEL